MGAIYKDQSLLLPQARDSGARPLLRPAYKRMLRATFGSTINHTEA